METSKAQGITSWVSIWNVQSSDTLKARPHMETLWLAICLGHLWCLLMPQDCEAEDPQEKTPALWTENARRLEESPFCLWISDQGWKLFNSELLCWTQKANPFQVSPFRFHSVFSGISLFLGNRMALFHILLSLASVVLKKYIIKSQKDLYVIMTKTDTIILDLRRLITSISENRAISLFFSP